MDITFLAARYDTLCKELQQRIAASSKWTGLPALLDEIHAVRCLYRTQAGTQVRTQVKAFSVSSEPGTNEAFRPHHQAQSQRFRYLGSLVQ